MMKDEDRGFAVYLLFQGLIAFSILGIVLDYATGQRAITTGILAGTMVLTAGYLAFGVWYLWRRLYRPLQRLEHLSAHWTELDDPVSETLALPGMVGGVAKSVKRRLQDLDRRAAALRKYEAEHSESYIRSKLLSDICRSMLPRILAQPETPDFSVAGVLESSGRSSCCLYDYFLLSPELLCVIVSEVSGEEIADALFLTSAQTTLRNRLRTDSSLEEAVNHTNAQLYDLGGQRSFRVLVGTLNLKSGRFHYVNAGEPQPLIMRRGQGRYMPLESPAYEPMGQVQQVSYRSMEVRLRQGDHLFLETSGLCGAKNKAGSVFYEQGLRMALNRSTNRVSAPSEILRHVADEAAAWVGAESSLPGFSAMLLAYLRSGSDVPSCDLFGEPESVPKLTKFLQKQCQERGLPGQSYARLCVIAEELFTLCCRYSKGLVRTECAVALNGKSVNIRMSADMGGRNPLENAEDMAAENAAEFILSHADHTKFQSENGEDFITVVCLTA